MKNGHLSAEKQRLQKDRLGRRVRRRWGPYVSER
jgi:hypothetical protein